VHTTSPPAAVAGQECFGVETVLVPCGRRARVHVFNKPFFYDPFCGPWYPYGYAYPYNVRPEADIRTEVTPKDTAVYVDGYYAGHADDFDGVFKRLHVAPGGHSITFHLEGFRTVTQDVYVRPDSTFKMNTAMERLAAGETSAPVPAPNRPPAPDRRSPRT
jgi:hypothetical protein